MAILIKRYANRKLYNTDTSRYITLKGIATLLDEREEVRVIDNETGEDITQIALSQILVDNKRAHEDPSDTLLTQILSRGGDALYGAIRKSVDEATEGLGEFQDRFRNLVGQTDANSRAGLGFAWDKSPKNEGPLGASGDQSPTGTTSSESDGRSGGASAATLDQIDQIVYAAVARAVNALDLPRKRDLEALGLNFDRVATAVERLERAYLPSEKVTTHASHAKPAESDTNRDQPD